MKYTMHLSYFVDDEVRKTYTNEIIIIKIYIEWVLWKLVSNKMPPENLSLATFLSLDNFYPLIFSSPEKILQQIALLQFLLIDTEKKTYSAGVRNPNIMPSKLLIDNQNYFPIS